MLVSTFQRSFLFLIIILMYTILSNCKSPKKIEEDPNQTADFRYFDSTLNNFEPNMLGGIYQSFLLEILFFLVMFNCNNILGFFLN